MSSDAGERLPDEPRADFSLPTVLDIEMRATRFEPPRLHNFVSALPGSDNAVEFIVKTEGPIPERALGPALFVGNTQVTEMTVIGPNTYRFVQPTVRGLRRNAPIRLGWVGQRPARRRDGDFRYHL